MYTKSWNVKTGATRREIKLHWSYWGGKRQVQVDGKTVNENTVPMRWKSTQPFEIDGCQCVVKTRPSSAFSPMFKIWLEVEGEKVAPVESEWETAAA